MLGGKAWLTVGVTVYPKGVGWDLLQQTGKTSYLWTLLCVVLLKQMRALTKMHL